MEKVQTLGEFIVEKQDDFLYSKGELTRLLSDIAIAAKIVHREVNKAGLAGILAKQEKRIFRVKMLKSWIFMQMAIYSCA